MGSIRRTLAMAIVFACGDCLGPIPSNAGESDAAAAKIIKSLDGTFSRDEPATDKPINAVSFTQSKVIDADMKVMTGLTKVQFLSLDDTKVGDAGLKAITGLREMRRLFLGNTLVTDAGLKEVARLENLK